MTFLPAGRLLAGSFILLQAIDFCFTHLLLGGIRPDVYEANPLATRILDAHGWSGLALFKLLCTIIGLAAVALLRRHRAAAAQQVLVVMCLVVLGVVVYGGALLAGPTDPAAAELPKLERESDHINQSFRVLREFDSRKSRVCNELLAGRYDLDTAITRMGECLEESRPHFSRSHGKSLPDVSRPDQIAAYLFLKASSMVVRQPAGNRQLQQLRQEILTRFPNVVLVDLSTSGAPAPQGVSRAAG